MTTPTRSGRPQAQDGTHGCGTSRCALTRRNANVDRNDLVRIRRTSVTIAVDTAGTVDAPLTSSAPCSRASASSRAMPWT
jgi:hypothetical protein